MARQADFIQENVPEQLELKQRVLAESAGSRRPTSSSRRAPRACCRPTCSATMVAPERFLVAHPFNPVYLLPLVELVRRHADGAADHRRRERHFSRYIGMHPLHVRKEVPGHLTDRLQEALWREILHMVNDGVATTGELDESIVYGPGLRWAGDGHEPDLPPRRRRDRHAPHAGAIRPVPEMAVDAGSKHPSSPSR